MRLSVVNAGGTELVVLIEEIVCKTFSSVNKAYCQGNSTWLAGTVLCVSQNSVLIVAYS